MKRFLTATAAAIALVGCTQNEVFEHISNDNAISLGIYAYKHTDDITEPTETPSFMDNLAVEIADNGTGGQSFTYTPVKY